jgi:hypothetical protein
VPQLSAPPDAAGTSFSVPAVDVNADRVLRIHGYVQPDRVRPRVRAAAEQATRDACELARGRVGYRRLAIRSLQQGTLRLEDGSAFHCAAFERYLDGCRAVVVFVLTAGPAFDPRIVELMDGGQPVEGLFLDTAGWLAVESVTRQFSTALRKVLQPQGLGLTRRLGPGYSYRIGGSSVFWLLEAQHDLFSALGTDLAPARLLTSAAMQPKMSRSGIYGLRPLR